MRYLSIVAAGLLLIGGCSSERRMNSLYSELREHCEFSSSVDSSGVTTVEMRCDPSAFSSRGKKRSPFNILKAIPAQLVRDR